MTTPREQEIERIEALIAAEEGVEVEKEEEEVEEEEQEEEVVEQQKEEVEKPTEEPAKEVKLEVKTTEAPAESTAWYKLREETRKREALERENEELKRPKIAKEEDVAGFLEAEIGATKQELAELKAWRAEQERIRQDESDREGAFRELQGYETEAAQAFPDFNEAANYAKSMIAASIKLLNQAISPQDLAQQTLHKYAQQAAVALNNKKHPGQAIYETAAQWGYKKAEAEKPKIELKSPSLAKLAENKKKSSGMNGSGGGGKNDVGSAELLQMTNAERMKLTPADWDRLEQEA